MIQTLTVEQIAQRLHEVETEVELLRAALQRHAHPGTAAAEQNQSRATLTRTVDKQLLKQAFDQMFEKLGITGQPISPEELQRQMGAAELTGNEFSQGIIAMRQE